MNCCRGLRGAQITSGPLLTILLTSTLMLAAGGTSKLPKAMRPVPSQPHWPEGVAALLNHPTQTEGWNPWFTEWPNDVNHYEFDVQNVEQLNQVIEDFARIQAEGLQIRLSPGSEPRGIGWASQLREGNGTAVLFSLGNQHRIDRWFDELNGNKFGQMDFEQAPRAVPPTLTIFIQNEAIDLDRLEISKRIEVSAGAVPAFFGDWNLKSSPERGKRKPPAKGDAPDAEAQQAVERIEAFLRERN